MHAGLRLSGLIVCEHRRKHSLNPSLRLCGCSWKAETNILTCKTSVRNEQYSIVHTKSRSAGTHVPSTEAISPWWIIVFWAVQDFYLSDVNPHAAFIHLLDLYLNSAPLCLSNVFIIFIKPHTTPFFSSRCNIKKQLPFVDYSFILCILLFHPVLTLGQIGSNNKGVN